MLDLLSDSAQTELKQELSVTLTEAVQQLVTEHERQYLNQQEAAEYLHVSTRYFREELVPQGIPTIEYPNVVRYSRTDLDEFAKRFLHERRG